ncbi:ROK family protein [Acidobacteria bacterium AH-259-D05]|nr:ROK family protein [Acidobacteria bacterium AH-259-D05]
MSAIVFDLGGTHLRCGIVDESGAVRNFERERIQSFIHNLSACEVWAGIVSSILDFEARTKKDIAPNAPIILSFPGPVAEHSRILNAPTVVGKTTNIPDLQKDLSRETGRKVYILNDISAAAWYLSQMVSANRFMVVTVSSGIGSKVFDRRHPDGVLDDPPYGGEIGHVIVDDRPDALVCDCGGHGHLGAISSGRGIERLARRQARENPSAFRSSSCVVEYGASATSLTNEDHLLPAAGAGDSWALNVIREGTRPLGTVLLSVILGVGLEKVIVIGGFAQALGDPYLEILHNCIAQDCDYVIMSDYLDEILILGDDTEACLLGSAVYARHIEAPFL